MLFKFVVVCALTTLSYGVGADLAESPEQAMARVAAHHAQVHETTEAAGYNYSRFTDTKVPTVSIFELDEYYAGQE